MNGNIRDDCNDSLLLGHEPFLQKSAMRFINRLFATGFIMNF